MVEKRDTPVSGGGAGSSAYAPARAFRRASMDVRSPSVSAAGWAADSVTTGSAGAEAGTAGGSGAGTGTGAGAGAGSGSFGTFDAIRLMQPMCFFFQTVLFAPSAPVTTSGHDSCPREQIGQSCGQRTWRQTKADNSVCSMSNTHREHRDGAGNVVARLLLPRHPAQLVRLQANRAGQTPAHTRLKLASDNTTDMMTPTKKFAQNRD